MYSYTQWLENNADEIKQNGMKQLFGDGEFKVCLEQQCICVIVHGVQFIVRENGVEHGQHQGEAFLWQLVRMHIT